jgi:hypothetical protein
LKCLFKTLGRGDLAIVVLAALLIAYCCNRVDHLLGEFCTFANDCIYQVRGNSFTSLQRCVMLLRAEHIIHYKMNVAQGSFVVWHG